MHAMKWNASNWFYDRLFAFRSYKQQGNGRYANRNVKGEW